MWQNYSSLTFSLTSELKLGIQRILLTVLFFFNKEMTDFRTCDIVFIGLAILFIAVLVWRIWYGNKEPFANVSCGCSPKKTLVGGPRPSCPSTQQLENAFGNINSNPDNKWPGMTQMGASPTGAYATPPQEQMAYNESISAVCGSQDFFDMVEEVGADPSKDPNPAVFVGDACLPPSMTNGLNDPTFEVYDRKIGQLSTSRLHQYGDMLRGDLFICPNKPTDAYGSQWFAPQNTTGALNAGALRFISQGCSNDFTNVGGDSDSPNLDLQYASASEC
jgi:hypothetical protein